MYKSNALLDKTKLLVFSLTETPGFFSVPVRSCCIEACKGGGALKLIASEAVEISFSTCVQTADGYVTKSRPLGEITAQDKRCGENMFRSFYCIFIKHDR